MAKKNKFLGKLSVSQKFSLFIFLVLLISLPLIVLVVKLQQDYRSRAYVPSATPIITTTILPSATIGRNYQATVSGLDTSGYGSALTMSFANLPAGLSKGPCQIVTPTPNRVQPITPPTPTSLPGNISPTRFIATPSATPTVISQTPPTRIFCLITGTPTSTGSFSVVVTLSNGRTGLISSRGISLSVNLVTQVTRTIRPSPICTQIAGQCLSPNGSCVSFSDGCQINSRCKVPFTACGVSATPTPLMSPPTTPPAGPTGRRRWF